MDDVWTPIQGFWKPEKEGQQIEGVVTNVREVTGDFGQQTVVDVGPFSVGISGGLKRLPGFENMYVRITYQGWDKTKKGTDFKKFLIEVRK